MLTLPIDDLIRWNDTTHTQWAELLRAHPEAMQLSADIRDAQSLAQVLQHIVAVEQRYAERLAGLPESDYTTIPYATPDYILATHERALSIIRPLLADPTYDWSHRIEFQTITAGRLRATRRDILAHLLLHSIRHFAQLATLIRQAGIKPTWPMDFLFVNAERVS